MRKNKKRLFASWVTALMVVCSVFLPLNTAYAEGEAGGTDKTAALTDVTVTVRQGGNEIPEGGTLTSTEPISVEVSFGVPVEGDETTPDNPVHKGDTATFELSDAFTSAPSDSVPLNMGEITVGHVTFVTDPDTKMVAAHVVFDGDDEVFDGRDNSVTGKFTADFAYDSSGDSGSGGDSQIQILDKTYTVHVPPAKIDYTVTKRGVVDLADQSVTWTVDLSATQAGTPIDLAGYRFVDDLNGVGDYIDGSFLVEGDSSAAPDSVDGNTIRYTFPENSQSPQAVSFKTKIPDDSYYTASKQSITNKAQLQNNEDEVVQEGQYKVEFMPKWIEKTGTENNGSSGEYNPTNRTITWTITANQNGATLPGAVITDPLPAGLILQSASLQTWNGSGWGASTDVTPNADGEYELGTITSKILLTIVTKIPDPENGYVTEPTKFTNSARIRWEGGPADGIGTGNIAVGVGYNAITKNGSADPSTGKIHWTVTVDTRGQSAFPNPLTVYDLLVYGSSTGGFDIGEVTGIPDGIRPGDLTPRYDQKYIEGTFAGEGLGVTVHPIMQDGTRVADLLEITGLSNSASNTFTFDSQVVNPNVFAGNKTSHVLNTATLFSADLKLNAATKDVSYPSRMLSKEMLKREAQSAPAESVNSGITTDAGAGFNYKDKSVIFRLSVDADGMHLSGMTNAAGQALGKATVTDTLPDGWEFMPITEDGADYLIFEGNENHGGTTVTAADATPDTVAGLTAAFSGKTATFTFDPLNRPYVILVKAKPTDAAAAGYFGGNRSTTVTNTVALQTENWTPAPGVNDTQQVTIDSEILEKSLTPPESGTLRWTVDYKPYDLDGKGTRLEDTLPAGIDLRTDSNGKLLLADNITANELTLKADGSYEPGNAVDLTLDGNVFYDSAARVLTFSIPDSTKAYRFSYLTDITGEPGDTISNHVSLYGAGSEPVNTENQYKIQNADGSASLQRNGWISIAKTDGEGTPLAGAEFTLFAADGETVVRKGVTGSGGALKLKVIPDGDYILRETAAPSGYALEGVDHSLSVRTEGSAVVSSIDGKTGDNANAVTVQDFTTGTAGSLTIRKTIAGDAADPAKRFDFTLTLTGADSAYPYLGHGGAPSGTIRSGDTVSLAGGQSITILGLPKDAAYTVTEADYSGDGYSKTGTGEAGTIAADITQTASFTNTKTSGTTPDHPAEPDHPTTPDHPTGSLSISKTVAGNASDPAKKFDFTVTLDGAAGAYAYTGHGVPDGTIRSGNKVSLAHGQSITITDLPEGTKYTVTEADYSGDGYTAVSTGAAGVIAADAAQTASFTNTRDAQTAGAAVGSLTIRKTVAGNLADREHAFTFVVTLSAGGRYQYSGSKTGTIGSGEAVALKHGESIVIRDLPVGTAYRVAEKEADQNGYSTVSTGASGEIVASGRTAAFVNTKSSVPKTGDDDPLGTVGKIGLTVSALMLLALVGLDVAFRARRSGKNR